MRALLLQNVKEPVTLQSRGDVQPSPGEVVVRLQAAALNRRDYWITQGMYPGVRTPVVLGSDGAGVVSRLGKGASENWLNQEVVINPGIGWGDDVRVQSDGFEILGMPRDGTFADETAVPADLLHPRPTHLDWQQSAALPLAGLTAYRALMVQGELKAGETVLVTGIGGGVATMLLRFAVAVGAEVIVTSSDASKRERALQLGAVGALDYTDSEWVKQCRSLHKAPSLIIDSAGGPDYGSLLELVKSGGRIVNYGCTAGAPPQLDLVRLFWKQIHIVGSTMGSPDDFASMLELVHRHQIEPVIDQVFPLEAGDSALKRMANSDQFGKIVLDIQS